MDEQDKKTSAYGGYGAIAQAFDELRHDHSPWVWSSLASLLKVPKNNALVLDIGCGTGISTEHARRASFKKTIGVDPDERMIAVSKRKRNISCSVAATDNLPFESEFFDAVFAYWSFDNFCNDSAQVKELMRVLKRGGVFMTVTWPLSSLGRKRNAIVGGFITKEIAPLSGYEVGDRSFRPLLEQYGFKDVTTQERTANIVYGLESAYKYMLSTSLFSHIEEAAWPQVYNALRKFCSDEICEKGEILSSINVIADFARKPY